MRSGVLRNDVSMSRLLLLVGILAGAMMSASFAMAAGEVEFAGTVLAADAKAGKLTVKKDAGGTRFTFLTNEETRWEPDLKGIGDLKKEDHVTVWYQMQGSQYVARRVARAK
jgi:hypothetical protein